MNDLDRLAVENFRQYLRIPSVHPDVNYDACVSFLKNQAESLDLPIDIHYCFPNKPIVILTWTGKEPDLPSILLNGHMDVVPVFKDEWTFDPFGAEMDKQGNIYGRGAQDMKSVSIQYLEAIRRLKRDGVVLKRTVHVSFLPDEEIGGAEGMGAFVQSGEFKKLNIGFALDEGMQSQDMALQVINGEKTRWVMRVHCPGQPGHGSLLPENTAGAKARKILNKIYEFREQEENKLKDDPNLTSGNITSVNLTIMEGGVQSNVIPSEFTLTIDCRISLTVDVVEFEKNLDEWCKEAGEGVWIEYVQKEPHIPMTNLDGINSCWMAFEKAFHEMNIQLKPQILPGITDSRYLRALGIPALGFSPITNTPTLEHDNNEYLNKNVFLRGIGIYYKLIAEIANV